MLVCMKECESHILSKSESFVAMLSLALLSLLTQRFSHPHLYTRVSVYLVVPTSS